MRVYKLQTSVGQSKYFISDPTVTLCCHFSLQDMNGTFVNSISGNPHLSTIHYPDFYDVYILLLSLYMYIVLINANIYSKNVYLHIFLKNFYFYIE